MELKQLEYFVRVAETSSFTRASVSLAVAQPALSRQIHNLESELGAQLLHRNGRGVSLTEAGAKFLVRAKSMLDNVRVAREEIALFSGTPVGSITIGMLSTVCQILGAPLVRRIRQACPNVSLRIIEGFSSGDINEWLSDGRIDIGIYHSAPGIAESMTAEELLLEDLYLVERSAGATSGSQRARFSELGELPLVLPNRQCPLRRLIDAAAAERGVVLNPAIEVESLSSIRELVRDGHGATVLSMSAVRDQVELGVLTARRIVEPPFTRTIVLATTTQRSPSLAVRTIARVIRSVVDELVSSGAWPGSALIRSFDERSVASSKRVA